MGVVGFLLVLIGIGFVTTVWGIPIGAALILLGLLLMVIAIVRGGFGALFRLFGPRKE
jgi:hypothetical protein